MCNELADALPNRRSQAEETITASHLPILQFALSLHATIRPSAFLYPHLTLLEQSSSKKKFHNQQLHQSIYSTTLLVRKFLARGLQRTLTQLVQARGKHQL
ncbi:hypothetical protein KC19_11G030100 [Ceratodon purpureus]|uniref:Uncharacterized protein n=1 Tax=Ceratodon purpureus TaxID=3225 RepID=A0A8T0GAI9_CERPU|nr:hypothetical protein KC19_11G030100 [Ceratodon purpureus]